MPEKRGAVAILIMSSLMLYMLLIPYAGAEKPAYSLGMKDISHQIKSGKANLVFVGDSITATIASPRIPYGVVREWKPDNWRGMVVDAIAGTTDQGTAVFNEPDQYSINVGVFPGENFPDGTRGYNLNYIKTYNITSDIPNGNTILRLLIYPISFANSTWPNNKPFKARFFYISGQSGTPVRVGAETHSGKFISNNTVSFTNNSNIGIYWHDYSIPRGSGGNFLGSFLQASQYSENSTQYNLFKPLGARIWRTDIETGMQHGYIGSGGFSTRSHTSQGEIRNIGGKIINTSYYDSALDNWIEGNELNIFVIWLGQNSANDEWNGITIGNYTNNVLSILNRYTDVYYKSNPSQEKPRFVLIATYDTADNNEKFKQISSSLANITKLQHTYPNLAANATIGFIDLRSKINDTNGSYDAWKNVYTSDGIHPNQAGSTTFAKYIWQEIMKAITPVYGEIDGFSFILESHTIFNETLGYNTGRFTNTDIYSQDISLAGLKNPLIYYDNNTVVCTDLGSCNNNINVTLVIQNQVYVLNNFNVIENETRQANPIFFTQSTYHTRFLDSNLTNDINVSTTLTNVENCTNIAQISDTIGPKQIFSQGQFSCRSNNLFIPILNIEPGNKTQLIFRRLN